MNTCMPFLCHIIWILRASRTRRPIYTPSVRAACPDRKSHPTGSSNATQNVRAIRHPIPEPYVGRIWNAQKRPPHNTDQKGPRKIAWRCPLLARPTLFLLSFLPPPHSRHCSSAAILPNPQHLPRRPQPTTRLPCHHRTSSRYVQLLRIYTSRCMCSVKCLSSFLILWVIS